MSNAYPIMHIDGKEINRFRVRNWKCELAFGPAAC